jgi:hypothetical protein
MKNTPQKSTKQTTSEVVHVRFTAAVYRAMRKAAESENRPVTNFIQTSVLEALARREKH